MEKECINAWNETEELEEEISQRLVAEQFKSGEINDNPYMEGLEKHVSSYSWTSAWTLSNLLSAVA